MKGLRFLERLSSHRELYDEAVNKHSERDTHLQRAYTLASKACDEVFAANLSPIGTPHELTCGLSTARDTLKAILESHGCQADKESVLQA